MKTKLCKTCGVGFSYSRATAAYCSDLCRVQASHRFSRPQGRLCRSCGQPFIPIRHSARFCGATCRQRFARAPHQQDRPVAVDLYCGSGGVAWGLMEAGYRVIGVDCKPQPDYPGEFILGDALTPPVNLMSCALVWASPPCQHASAIRNARARTEAPDLIEPTRQLLSKVPMTVIENVPGSSVRRDLVLRGEMFGRKLPRERWFELSFPVEPPVMAVPTLPSGPTLVSCYGKGSSDKYVVRRRLARGLPQQSQLDEVEEALGVYHVKTGLSQDRRQRLNQCIPPVYAELIGRAALEFIP